MNGAAKAIDEGVRRFSDATVRKTISMGIV